MPSPGQQQLARLFEGIFRAACEGFVRVLAIAIAIAAVVTFLLLCLVSSILHRIFANTGSTSALDGRGSGTSFSGTTTLQMRWSSLDEWMKARDVDQKMVELARQTGVMKAMNCCHYCNHLCCCCRFCWCYWWCCRHHWHPRRCRCSGASDKVGFSRSEATL